MELKELLTHYDLTPNDLGEAYLEELDSLLTSGELTQANEMLSDFAYEIHAGNAKNTKCALCNESVDGDTDAREILPFGNCCGNCVEDVKEYGTSRILQG